MNGGSCGGDTDGSIGAMDNPRAEAPPSARASGAFHPDFEYGKICPLRKGNSGTSDDNAAAGTNLEETTLDYKRVRDHIHSTDNFYFKERNPLVTHVRMEELRQQFTSDSRDFVLE